MTAIHDAVRIQGLRPAGMLLIGLPLLGMLVLAHHPTTQAHDVQALQQQLVAVTLHSRLVHGALILMQCALLYAQLSWLQARDLRRGLPRAAALMLVLGAIGVIGAALVDGFVVTAPAMYPHDDAMHLVTMEQLVRFAATLNQTLILAGEAATSIGIVMLALDLLSLEPLARAAGIAGVVLGAGTLVALFSGLLTLHLHGMQMLFAAQSVWLLWLGIVVVRRPSREAT
ncbi:hypothetical protein [Dyella telluris]|uniref:DUF4386 family protein n=1 Tax=Dyella telluris TaxID=2763498 RepID=A0A7G8Q1L2_9GAMM|nr:hypothetical protein [Dyella telluris]QNK00670.1 hypothetical protein H8F01_16470 [Dyella telluris]